MKRFISLLCIIALLLCMLSFASCKDDEVEEGGGEQTENTTDEGTAPETETSDKDIVNDNKTGNDDTAADIFS